MNADIRQAKVSDIESIKRIAVDAGMFGPEDVGFFDEMIGGFVGGTTEQYARTCELYARHGYVEEARILQFYGPSDDKVVFWKSLVD